MASHCHLPRICGIAVLAMTGIFAACVAVAESTVDERIDPAEISLGEVARLTITISRGNSGAGSRRASSASTRRIPS